MVVIAIPGVIGVDHVIMKAAHNSVGGHQMCMFPPNETQELLPQEIGNCYEK